VPVLGITTSNNKMSSSSSVEGNGWLLSFGGKEEGGHSAFKEITCWQLRNIKALWSFLMKHSLIKNKCIFQVFNENVADSYKYIKDFRKITQIPTAQLVQNQIVNTAEASCVCFILHFSPFPVPFP
jgi:hypothetical protein